MRTGITKRAVVLACCVLVSVACQAASRDLLSVDLDDPVYRIIELCSLRGLLGPVSAVKPYSRAQVRGWIREALGKKDLLAPAEVSILEDLERAFSANGDDTVSAEVSVGSDFRIDLSQPAAFHSSTRAGGEVLGGLGTTLSYGIALHAFLDKVDPEAFAPFDFTKQEDGFHVWSQDGKVLVSKGINDHLNFGSSAASELAIDVLQGAGNIQLSRYRREWGVGDGSLSLSGTARPIQALSVSVTPFAGAEFHFLTGGLGDWWDPHHQQKMLSLHRLELFPVSWLYISAWEGVVWAKRLELVYLDPLMSYFFGQQVSGDFDNIVLGADAAVSISPFVRLYASLFLDEISFVPLSAFWTWVNNRYAWQVGAKVPVPGLPWSLLTVQYTKIEPYTYTHSMQTLPQYTNPIDISYTNDEENIGYHLPPNSDELLVRFSSSPVAGVTAQARYQLIRHGTGDHLQGQIEGDINTPIVFVPPTVYPPKDFLHDGIYEWINAATVGVSVLLAPFDATVRAQYSFVSSRNAGNVEGVDVVKNLVEVGLTIRYAP